MSTPTPAGAIAPATDVVIAEGPASKAAKAVAALLALVTAVTAILHGDHTPETLAAGGGAVLVLVTYLAGRYAQAVAIFRDAPSPAQAVRELVESPDADELARAVLAQIDRRQAAREAKALRHDLIAKQPPDEDDEVDTLELQDEPPGAEDVTALAEPPAPDTGDAEAGDGEARA